MSPMRARLFAATIAACLLSAPSSRADKAACLDAASRAQSLRDVHKLLATRDALRVCAAAGCPAVVQVDCATWLNEVEAAIPTLVFAAKDGSGADLFDVSVTMDGAPLATKLDGRAVAVDPGPHTFVFGQPDGLRVEKRALVREGEKAQIIDAVLGAPPAPSGPEPIRAASPGGSAGKTQKIVAAVVAGAGIAGLGVGGALGLVAKASDNTARAETGQARFTDSSNAVSEGNAATVVFAVGGVAVAAGIVLWLTAPKGEATAALGTDGHQIFLTGRF
jgi:hypothetical protein